jgi:hypothetical protein
MYFSASNLDRQKTHILKLPAAKEKTHATSTPRGRVPTALARATAIPGLWRRAARGAWTGVDGDGETFKKKNILLTQRAVGACPCDDVGVRAELVVRLAAGVAGARVLRVGLADAVAGALVGAHGLGGAGEGQGEDGLFHHAREREGKRRNTRSREIIR